MSESVNYHCLACNGTLQFMAETGQLQCEFCGSTFTVEQIEQAMAAKQAAADQKDDKQKAKEQERAAKAAAAEGAEPQETPAAKPANAATPQGDPIQAFLNRAPWTTASEENIASYSCPACSAELLVDQTTAITECPYCGNNNILPNQVSGVMKPDSLIPFKITKDKAIAGLKRHYQGKSLLPKAFTSDNHLEHIQGVYVPFWLYTYKASGKIHYRAERIRIWDDPADNTMQETSTFACFREGSMEFKNVPADGSSKMPDAHMDAIEPFDYADLVPFSVGYLPGFAAERYDMDASACADRAVGRMETSVETALANTVEGYDNVHTEDKQVHAELVKVEHAMLPVWMLHTRWNNEDYLFAMNGQTGKMVGDLPIDKGKVTKWFLGVAVPVFAVVFGICQLML